MKTRLTLDHWLITRRIAHRGLHDKTNPENSIPAFKLAIEGNYTIEMDLHMTIDKRLMVFHDDNTKRMTGVDNDIREMTFEQVRELKLAETEEKIPEFCDFLKLVNGKVPLLIEVKNQTHEGIEELILKELENYKGDFAIQSFNPYILLKIKELKPEILRGQLGTKKAENQNFVTRIALHFLPFNKKVEPDFISYNVRDIPLKSFIRRQLPLLCWTVRTRSDLSKALTYANNYIFEEIRPVSGYEEKQQDAKQQNSEATESSASETTK